MVRWLLLPTQHNQFIIWLICANACCMVQWLLLPAQHNQFTIWLMCANACFMVRWLLLPAQHNQPACHKFFVSGWLVQSCMQHGLNQQPDGCSEKDVLPILCIISITQVTSRGGIVSPGHNFSSEGKGTKSEASHASINVTRKIKDHVSRKRV